MCHSKSPVRIHSWDIIQWTNHIARPRSARLYCCNNHRYWSKSSSRLLLPSNPHNVAIVLLPPATHTDTRQHSCKWITQPGAGSRERYPGQPPASHIPALPETVSPDADLLPPNRPTNPTTSKQGSARCTCIAIASQQNPVNTQLTPSPYSSDSHVPAGHTRDLGPPASISFRQLTANIYTNPTLFSSRTQNSGAPCHCHLRNCANGEPLQLLVIAMAALPGAGPWRRCGCDGDAQAAAGHRRAADRRRAGHGSGARRRVTARGRREA